MEIEAVVNFLNEYFYYLKIPGRVGFGYIFDYDKEKNLHLYFGLGQLKLIGIYHTPSIKSKTLLLEGVSRDIEMYWDWYDGTKKEKWEVRG